MEFQFSDTDKSPAFFCDENGGAGDKDKVELVGEKSEPKNKPKETSFSFVNALSFDAGSFSSGEFSHKILKRRNSLIETLNSGVCSDPGPKPSNEDVYRYLFWTRLTSSVVSWRKSPDKLEKPEDTKKNNNNASEEAPKSETIDASAEPATKKQKREEPEKKPDQEVDMFSQYAFFAVYDGHGGIQAAEYVNNHLLKNIIFNQHFPADVEQAIFAAFLTTDEQFAAYAKEKNIDGSVGTTVTFALIVGNTLYIANVGDSEAVLCSNGVANKITVAHSLANPNEKQRIEQSDGKIVTTSTSLRLGHPTWNSKLINIAVTRSIGDLYFKDPEYTQNKQSGLIAEPFITKRTITKQDDFLLIASDGFWDKMKTEDAVEYVTVNGAKDCDTLCRELVEISRARKSKDNITVLLIKFKPLGAGSFNFAI